VLIIAGLLVSLFVPRRRMWVKAARRPDGSVVLEYAGLARGEDPGLDAAVAAFADKHAGPATDATADAAGRDAPAAASGESTDGPTNPST
jgi:cytochrome c biogenesis protein